MSALPLRPQPTTPPQAAPSPGYIRLLLVVRQAVSMILAECERQLIDAGELKKFSRPDKRGNHGS